MAAVIKAGRRNGGAARLKPQARAPRLERDLLNRLQRAQGQLRGIARMVAGGTYCIDVLQQIAAVRGALDRIALMLLHDHIETCVADALARRDAEGRVKELLAAIDRLLG